METLPIKVSVATATKDEIERGLAAACAVFIKSGIDPETAAAGRSKLEAFDMQGFKGKLSSEACDAAFVWMEAEAAAAEAASANWSEDRLPADASLQLVFDPEAQFADREKALAMLREIATKGQRNDRDGTLARIVVEHLADRWKAKELVDNLTIAFCTLSLASYHPDEPVEPKRKAALEAIDALEAA
jgi:hypothetical protein